MLLFFGKLYLNRIYMVVPNMLVVTNSQMGWGFLWVEENHEVGEDIKSYKTYKTDKFGNCIGFSIHTKVIET